MMACKEKKCRQCKNMFPPRNSLQVVCNFQCALDYENTKRQRKADAEAKRLHTEGKRDMAKRKIALRSRSDWLKLAQAACNAYIRERDGKICISCGNSNKNIQFAAGHYKSRGACPELRFHPFNINSQCNTTCNLHLSGNIENYRPKLIDKIGESSVLWLEGKHVPQKWTIDDIQDITQYYKEQFKILQAERDGEL